MQSDVQVDVQPRDVDKVRLRALSPNALPFITTPSFLAGTPPSPSESPVFIFLYFQPSSSAPTPAKTGLTLLNISGIKKKQLSFHTNHDTEVKVQLQNCCICSGALVQ
jgi:hypothetical protein